MSATPAGVYDDDLNSIGKQNIGADCRGNTVHKAVQNTRFHFEEVVDENAVVGEDGCADDMESKSDKSYCEDTPPFEDSDGDGLGLPVAGSLVIRRTLQVQVMQDESTEQKENIFHTRCYVQSKVCGLIIDSGSCVNVCSTTPVNKLTLSTVKHTKPYRLRWLNDSGEVKVTNRLWFHFRLGNMLMKFCVMWHQCKQVTSCWGGLGNMTGRQFMMGLKIGIPL